MKIIAGLERRETAGIIIRLAGKISARADQSRIRRPGEKRTGKFVLISRKSERVGIRIAAVSHKTRRPITRGAELIPSRGRALVIVKPDPPIIILIIIQVRTIRLVKNILIGGRAHHAGITNISRGAQAIGIIDNDFKGRLIRIISRRIAGRVLAAFQIPFQNHAQGAALAGLGVIPIRGAQIADLQIRDINFIIFILRRAIRRAAIFRLAIEAQKTGRGGAGKIIVGVISEVAGQNIAVSRHNLVRQVVILQTHRSRRGLIQINIHPITNDLRVTINILIAGRIAGRTRPRQTGRAMRAERIIRRGRGRETDEAINRAPG